MPIFGQGGTGVLGNYSNGQGGLGGILGGAQQQPEWASKLGLFSAALKDFAAQASGREDPGALQSYQQSNQQNQIRQQLLGALQSQDPAVRQQGYQAAAMLGIPTDVFQKQQVQQQLPQLLSSMKPSQQTLPSASATLENGSQINTGDTNFQVPGLNIQDAISQAPPELQAQYAPKLLEQQLAAQADASKPFELSPGQVRFGPNGQEIARLPEKPNYNAAFNSDGTPNKGYQDYEMRLRQQGRDAGLGTDAMFSTIDTGSGVYGVTRGGKVSPFTGPDGKPLISYHSDPQTRFDTSAAGSAGKAAGTAAEALPATDANFNIINDTLASFEKPEVRAQANHALGWQGKATFGASIPGVTSDFNARHGQLEGEAFLNAFNSLKGGGAITEMEGSKATSAIARLNKAQTPTEFYNALNDAKGTFRTIYQSAQQRANRGAVVPALRSPQTPALPQSPASLPRLPAKSKTIRFEDLP